MTKRTPHQQPAVSEGAESSIGKTLLLHDRHWWRRDSDVKLTHHTDMETPPLDIENNSPSIPRVKLPDVTSTVNYFEKTKVEDEACDGLQSNEASNESAAVSSREEHVPESSSETSLPHEKASKEENHTAQRTSTESGSSRSKTYSIAELVELGYRSRRVSRDELRLSDEAPIGKHY